mmetsp:Transcript_87370/g.154920  ORF Transcript_87370/g.154920 Transcript_87370/m.154920 type:complete len:100 (-) Transcript_87370:717-1016(-)
MEPLEVHMPGKASGIYSEKYRAMDAWKHVSNMNTNKGIDAMQSINQRKYPIDAQMKMIANETKSWLKSKDGVVTSWSPSAATYIVSLSSEASKVIVTTL